MKGKQKALELVEVDYGERAATLKEKFDRTKQILATVKIGEDGNVLQWPGNNTVRSATGKTKQDKE